MNQHPQGQERQTAAVAVLLPSLLQILALMWDLSVKAQGRDSVIGLTLWYISLLGPLPFGLWAGLTGPRRRPLTYLFMGLAIGTIGVAAYVLVLANLAPNHVFQRTVVANWMALLAGYPLFSAFLFTSGALFGTFLEVRLSNVTRAAILGSVAAVVSVAGAILGAISGRE